MGRLQHKVTNSLKAALEKLKLSENTAETKGARKHLSSPFHATVESAAIHFFGVDVKVMLTVRVNGWPVGIALTCIIHFMVFEEQLTGTGQVIIAIRVSLRALPSVEIIPVSLFPFYSLQRTTATKSRSEQHAKTEAALK